MYCQAIDMARAVGLKVALKKYREYEKLRK